MSTAHACSVFLSSYRNTVLNQSACIFALGYFLINDINQTLCIIITETIPYCFARDTSLNLWRIKRKIYIHDMYMYIYIAYTVKSKKL